MALPFSFRFPAPLLKGKLLRRRKRFFADVKLDDGRQVTAHCVNTGSMEGIVRPGLPVWISPADNPKRKLKWTWELVEVDRVMVGANTAMPNRLVRAMLEARALPGFTRWRELRPEKPYGENSRIDFWLRDRRGEHFIEVKNCHLVYSDGRGYFPDSVSDRATKHLEELIEVVGQGARATVLFTVQHGRAIGMRPSDVHDPAFAAAARRAHAAGVRFKALSIEPTPKALVVRRIIPADLKPYPTKKIEMWREKNRRR